MTDQTIAWPQGQRCAVSLTYDDGLPVHYRRVAPLLEEVGLRATFYVPALSDLQDHPDRWQQVARRGHELGNHSLFHPCRRTPDREAWLSPWLDLGDYTLTRLRHELATASLMLHLVDGETERSYGNTCCETTVGRGEDEVAMDPVLRDLFTAARGPFNERVVDVRQPVDLMGVGHFGADGMTFEEIRTAIEQALEIGGWIVWMIHGVGASTHNHFLDAAEHEQLIRWLGEERDRIWTAPFIKVAQQVRHHQA